MLQHENDDDNQEESGSDSGEHRKRAIESEARAGIPTEITSPSEIGTTDPTERYVKRSRLSQESTQEAKIGGQRSRASAVAQVAALPREQDSQAFNQSASSELQMGASSQLDSYQRYLQLSSDAGGLSRLATQQQQQANIGQGSWGSNPAVPSLLGNTFYMGQQQQQQQQPDLTQYLQLQALGHQFPPSIAGLGQPQLPFGYGGIHAMDPFLQAQLVAARLNQPSLDAARLQASHQDQPQQIRAGLAGLGGGMYGGLGLAAAYGQQQNPLLALQGNGMAVQQQQQQQQQGGIPVSLPVLLALPEDNIKLSSHQILLRHQIEAFQATEDDLTTHTRGRNKPITLGQVGIRCRHCAHLRVGLRQKGSTYFPASLLGLYQAAQNMSTTHMQCGLCTEMPNEIKQQFVILLSSKVASSGAGRPYWAKSANKLGLVDTDHGIRFIRDIPSGVNIIEEEEEGAS